ncbi:MAG TPA: peptidoglycan editing factor PgeF [Motiliproteus sp.]
MTEPCPLWLQPEWPAPVSVRALATTRLGGVSAGPYDSLNLGDHVGDDPERVAANRERLQQAVGTEVALTWLQQVHGVRVVDTAAALASPTPLAADAVWTQQPNHACVVMTADCLPVLFCDRAGTRVAAAHAGWRGLADGVLESTLAALGCDPAEVLCWFGPAIGATAFEVGGEVRARFVADLPESTSAFIPPPGGADKWLADLYQLARLRLAREGVSAFYGGEHCTHSDAERFFSYRRDGVTGRMASLIWLAQP